LSETGLAFTPALRERIAANLAAHEPRLLQSADARPAAVGVVLLPNEAGQACFVLTRRPTSLRRHSGQWALPGGRLEPGESAADAVLREIQEEVGLSLAETAILGRVDDFVTRSQHLISPFVLWVDGPHELQPDPVEVAAVYRVPLQDLERPDNPHRDPLLNFALLQTTVFAPTAAILLQFRELALHARHVSVQDEEQPYFAWR
jgi:8-oxo-dGTP pyrophosphatase MutT (NUDIX family)